MGSLRYCINEMDLEGIWPEQHGNRGSFLLPIERNPTRFPCI